MTIIIIIIILKGVVEKLIETLCFMSMDLLTINCRDKDLRHLKNKKSRNSHSSLISIKSLRRCYVLMIILIMIMIIIIAAATFMIDCLSCLEGRKKKSVILSKSMKIVKKASFKKNAHSNLK